VGRVRSGLASSLLLSAWALTAAVTNNGVAVARDAHDIAPNTAPAELAGHIEASSFWSTALGRTMPYRLYLPPGYADGTQRYSSLYLLHGMGGSDREWQDLGIASAADRLIATGQIAPLIIVMPEGQQSYWVDHASGGEQWGRYTAVDLVSEIDATYRTVAHKRSRAIGGLSMGAQGALQLALNHPDEFGAVGAHSLVLRRFGSAPTYFGSAAEFATRDPMQIVRTRGAGSCGFALWIDIGQSDPWTSLARQFDSELTDLGVRHEWHVWQGDHSGSYWSAHLDDYLRFYDGALSSRAARTTLS
jgi:enterochelin esterase-like enzyme